MHQRIAPRWQAKLAEVQERLVYELERLRGLAAWMESTMHDFTQNTATQAEVKVFILDNLWQSLPRPPFTDEDTETLAGRVYDYVWQRSAGGQGVHAV